MTQTEIVQELARIAHEVAEVDIEAATSDKSLITDLLVDSLSVVEIYLTAEDTFGVRIPEEDLVDFRTLGDAAEYIRRALAG
ncbi:acyl carrier protein [Spirillospora sp. NPDC048911]|uniref:acyl carrier protein n=1 Tax=Spirillospora sp. NPDC048911 TaxID=3364527 RepID=UPI0037155420